MDPVGLQCKRRTRWPVKKLTTAEVDAEVSEALKFDPPLESFYILTTAADDTKLQAHVRAINKRHNAQDRFNVVLLGWAEIVRRATLHESVANKHFGGSGGAPRSPLLATWFSSNGKLELNEWELKIAVTELAQDLQDWPTGHIAFRQRETDALLDQIHAFVGRDLTLDEREERIRLRKKLRRMTDREARIVKGLQMAICQLQSEPSSRMNLIRTWAPSNRRMCRCASHHRAIPKFGRRSTSRRPPIQKSGLLCRNESRSMDSRSPIRSMNYRRASGRPSPSQP
jgi:hypothetical protein